MSVFFLSPSADIIEQSRNTLKIQGIKKAFYLERSIKIQFGNYKRRSKKEV